MFNKGFLKRMLPFFATFAFGIFIASFFVTIGSSRVGHHGRDKCRHEAERLREENLQLQFELDSMHKQKMNLPRFESEAWEIPNVEEPVLPPPPTMREHRPKAR